MDQLNDATAATPAVLDAVWQVCDDSPIEPNHLGFYPRLKRLMDIVIAGIMFVAFLPIMLIVALAIKVDSRGPVLFAQDRVGYDPATDETRLIRVYKFRTMRFQSDEEVHRAYVTALIKSNAGTVAGQSSLKMVRDKRVTRVGRWLRRTSLDELPQLINVLLGQMSLVGPRPALPYEVAAYADWHRGRLKALPGMTGWWQVTGRNRVSFDEMVCLDIYYIRHRSLALDLKILLLTPVAVISMRGAG